MSYRWFAVFEFRRLRLIAAVGLFVGLAGVCPSTAFGQTYTWTGATDTNFNDPANYTAGLTFPTSGTLRLTSGTAIPNAPTLTASATAAAVVFGQATAFDFGSSDAAAVLRLTGPTPLSISNAVTGTIGANLALGGSGTQTFSLPGTTVFSGTISGGNAGDSLWFTAAVSNGPSLTVPHSGNTFASTARVGGSRFANGQPNGFATTVESLGMTGQSSSFGTADKIVLSNLSTIFLSTTAAAQSSDKSLELQWINGTGTNWGGGSFGLNGNAVGFNQSFVNLYGTRPALNLSGSITAAPIVGWSGTAPLQSTFYTGQSGTLSGVISDSANHVLNVWSYGAVLTNPNNTFSGTFAIGKGAPGSYNLPALGMIGSPSLIGSGSTVVLQNDVRLRYTGAGETSNKTFNFIRNDGGGTWATIDASGSGELILSNTAAIGGLSNMSLRLGGTGRGTLASYVTSTSTGISKYDAGTWTLTGSNAVTQAFGLGGTLVFANRVSLLGGGTADWVKSKVLTASGSGAVMAYRVGGTGEFTNQDVTTLITNLSGDVSTGGMRSTSSWGFDTTNSVGAFTVADVIANTTSGSGGAIGVVKLGSGTLALGGANTYTLGTEVRGGVLTITSTSALGSGTGFLRFTGGTLDLAGFTVDRGGPMTATTGGLTNGAISGTGGLTKTGSGTFRIDATANTFTGAVAIQEGVVEAAVISGSGVASSLGSGTGANATINLGNLATVGTLRYVGSGNTTNRVLNMAGTTGGSTLDASGSGPLVFSSAMTATGAGIKTLTLTGDSTAANSISSIGHAAQGVGVEVAGDDALGHGETRGD